MNRIVLLLLLVVAGCATTRIPPPGELWARQAEFGYTDVYGTVDEIAKPVAGASVMLQDLQKALERENCERTDRLILMMVIDEVGQVIGVHIDEPRGDLCETTAIETLSRYLHEPAMLDGEPVKMVIAVPVDFKRVQPVRVRRIER